MIISILRRALRQWHRLSEPIVWGSAPQKKIVFGRDLGLAKQGALPYFGRPGRLTQRLECHLHTVEVIGSNPISPTTFWKAGWKQSAICFRKWGAVEMQERRLAGVRERAEKIRGGAKFFLAKPGGVRIEAMFPVPKWWNW